MRCLPRVANHPFLGGKPPRGVGTCDNIVEFTQGLVYVPHGVKHKAIGKLTVCVPRGVFDDVHELD